MASKAAIALAGLVLGVALGAGGFWLATGADSTYDECMIRYMRGQSNAGFAFAFRICDAKYHLK